MARVDCAIRIDALAPVHSRLIKIATFFSGLSMPFDLPTDQPSRPRIQAFYRFVKIDKIDKI